MRRVRKSLINKGTKPKTTVALDEAVAAREANLLGKNGTMHGQDRYLAQAEAGDLVIPLNELSTETRTRLEAALGPLEKQQMGKGGELPISALQADGLGLAEVSDIPALLALGERMHAETVYRDIRYDQDVFRHHIDAYLADRGTHQIFIHKQEGRLQAALFAKATTYFFSNELLVSEDLFYVYPEDRSFRLARKMVTAFEVWAQTLGAVECCLAVSTGVEASRIGRLYEALGYVSVGGVFKKNSRH